MAYIKVLQCDECGAKKEQVNGWFAMVADDSDLGRDDTYLASYRMHNLSEDDAEPLKHYCGQQCAGKAFHRWLDTGSIDKQDSLEMAADTEAAGA